MPHPRAASVVRRVARALAVVLLLAVSAAVGAAIGAPPARAGTVTPPRVHHVLPENGAVLRAAPDHVEVMVDVDLVPGQVDVALAPDATGRLVALPGPPVLDGPLLVQPLPPLPPGRYTVGLQIRGAGGQVARGTFGFAVDPTAAAPSAATPAAPPRGDGLPGWLLPAVATALLVPAGTLLGARRLRPRRPAPGGAGPARAAGRRPTSTSSPAARRGRCTTRP
jgi:methionine-rich copper-binding protein CopC